jgi:hypothetical protein
MKKFVPLALFALSATVCISAQQQSQSTESLGDVARKQRAADEKAPAKKVWTDDDFASTSSAPAASPATAPADAATKDADKSGDKSSDKAAVAADTREKKQDTVADAEKLNTAWKEKLDAQKAKIADLQREYDLTDREYKLSLTSYYADAGNRLRDQKDFTDKETTYKGKLGTLKQQISDEQAKLGDLQDQAHKAGADKAFD